MKITASLLLSASFFCLVSCSESKTETNAETATITDLEKPAQTTAPASETATPAASASPTVIEMPAAAANQNVKIETPAGMNPPHGQPGHDCAVAVGAPLNSKGNAAAAPQVISAPQPAQPTMNAAPATATAPGMNPPHGQPGHDCAIAVGAPLKK